MQIKTLTTLFLREINHKYLQLFNITALTNSGKQDLAATFSFGLADFKYVLDGTVKLINK